MKVNIYREKVYLCRMEQNNSDGSGSAAQVENGDNSQTAAAAMTYANLETLTRLNSEDLTSILSTANHQRDHTTAHYADSSGTGDEPTGYIVTMATEASSAEAYALASQASYVVATGTAGEPGNDGTGGVDESTGENEAGALDPQLAVHSYCKPNLRVSHVSNDGVGAAGDDVESGQVDTAGTRGTMTAIGDGVSARSADILDLKTVLPGPTTRRVLLIDDGHGDLEMAKSDVEFLLRGDAAGIVLREGKRSEVWSRFGKVTFQGRKVKGYVACIYCRQVYAFGDAHSTGTSTLKKHRCPAQSLVTTASPLTPTGVLPSHSPAPSLTQTDHNAYVNFPSPSVIVSIATMRNSVDSTTETGPTIPTRYLSSSERDELIRNAGVFLGLTSSSSAATGFLQLAKGLVELGAKHGAPVAEDLNCIFKSPLLETLLPSLAYEYRSHFIEEAKTCSTGIGLVLAVSDSVGLTHITLKMSYSVTNTNSPFIRHTPLRHIQLNRDDELHGNIADFVRRTLKEEKLDHLRRSMVCNRPDLLEAVFCGEMAITCASSITDIIMKTACDSQHYEWKKLLNALQKVANAAQLMGWELHLTKMIKPAEKGWDYLELVLNCAAQVSELQKLWQDQRLDVNVWNQIDRHLLNHVSSFLASVQVALLKMTETKNEPSLFNILLARSHLLCLCTPKAGDPAGLLAIKDSLVKAVHSQWKIEMLHRLACVLHPAFKHMKRFSVSDRERTETYSMVRHLLRQVDNQPSDHILRNTLESGKNGEGRDLKRKGGRSDSTTTSSKRQRTSSMTTTAAAAANNNNNSSQSSTVTDCGFDFHDMADFHLNTGDASGMIPDRDELDLYLEEKVIQQDMIEFGNVFIYWKNRKNVFPSLSRLACWILALPPSVHGNDCSLSKSDSLIQRLLFQIVAQSNNVAVAHVE